MVEFEDIYGDEWGENRPPDPAQKLARARLEKFFDENREKVFFSRQLEVQHEKEFFHWVTNRAIREMEGAGALVSERRRLQHGGSIKLVWHPSYRYHRRAAMELVKLVEEYAHPNVGGALGSHGELMALEGFALKEFVLKGRHTREFNGKSWRLSEHDLDFVFERDGRAYGVEVKNTLGYMEYRELQTKIKLCREIGLVPVFVVRMLPKVWVHEVVEGGGFALILKYQLYPPSHRDLARRVASELGLPVDAPRALADGTVERFLVWHRRFV